MRWLNDKNSVGNPVFGDQPRNSIHQLQLHKWDCNPIHQVLPKTWVIRVVFIDLHDLSTSTVASSEGLLLVYRSLIDLGYSLPVCQTVDLFSRHTHS